MRFFWKTFFSIGSSLAENNYLSILIYHRVLEKKDYLRPDSVDALSFSRQMNWIKNHFIVLPLYEAVDLIRQGRLPKRALSITFDDGYVDNLTVALPILNHLNLPASFYVSSKMLGASAMWNDEVIESIRSTKLHSLEVSGKVFDIKENEGKRRFIEFFEVYYKSLPLSEANSLLRSLVDEMGSGQGPPLFMCEKQIVELSLSNMEIGSHGRNHNILSALPSSEAQVEICQSKKEIESVTGVEVKGFAFPNGKAPDDFTHEHSKMVANAGYYYALSTNYGCSSSCDELFKLKRFTPWKPGKLGFLSSMFLNYWYYQENV